MHPHIYITADQIEGLRSVENVRQGIRDGHLEVLRNQLRALADADVARKPFIPSSVIPGRPQLDIEHENRDWILINAVAQRIQRAALAYLLSERPEYRDDALRQMEAVFYTNTYPDWRDKAHPRTRVDLRAGQLSQAIALAYDWMHPLLSSEERSSILEGLDKRAIQLYLQDVDDRRRGPRHRRNGSRPRSSPCAGPHRHRAPPDGRPKRPKVASQRRSTGAR